MISQKEVLKIFKETGALLKGHFQLTSGGHTSQYLQCALVLQYPQYSFQLCSQIAERFKHAEIKVVIAPAIGGIVIAQEVARILGVRAIFSERERGKMTLRRGFKIEEKERVLVVEDVVTTGGSVKETMEVIEERKGQVVGVGFLVERSGGRIDFGVPQESLLILDLETYQPDRCPLCKRGISLKKLGSRK